MESRTVQTPPDVQASAPTIHVSLSRVGVTGVEKIIRIGQPGDEQLFSARLECFVDLGPRQKGAHMSRFEEVVNDAIGEVVLGETGFRAEALAQRIAERVRERQDALRAEVTIAARYPEHKPAPVSGIPTQEIYTLYGSAVASERGTRRLVGVAAQGMTACPCAQQLVAGRARERLGDEGFSDADIARILEAVPVATHNQRGLGTLHIGCPEDCDDRDRGGDAPRDRRGLDVERDLRAHEALRRGRRRREGPPSSALRRGLRARDGRPASSSASATSATTRSSRPARRTSRRSTSTTSSPSASALLGELRHELDSGEHLAHHTSMREWLDAAGR